MKKIINNFSTLIFAIIIGQSSMVNGQSTSFSNIYAAGRYLGWGVTSGNLEFKTNGITRMTLQNTAGNFGIGIAAPSSKLDVSGNTFITGNFINTSSIGIGVNGSAVNLPGFGVGVRGNGGSVGVSGYAEMAGSGNRYGMVGYGKSGLGNNYGMYADGQGGASAYGLYATATGATTNWAGYFDNGNVYMKNKLGIGTTSPAYVLHVKGSVLGYPVASIENTNPTGYAAGLYVSCNTTPGSGNAISATGGSIGVAANANVLGTGDRIGLQAIGEFGTGINTGVSAFATEGVISYGISSVATWGTDLNYGIYASAAFGATNWAGYFDDGNVYIKNKVGINTLAPATALDVTGSGHFTGTLGIGAYTMPSTDGSSGQVLKTNGSGILAWQDDNNGGASQWGNYGSDIYYNSGRVGIGTSTPYFPLEAAGNDLETARFSNNNPTNAAAAVNAFCTSSPGNGIGVIASGGEFGLKALAMLPGSGFRTGIETMAGGGTAGNTGIHALASGGAFAYGLICQASDATDNYGIYASAAYGTSNWAAYFANGNVHLDNKLAIGSMSTLYPLYVSGSGTYAGYFNGDVYTTGAYTTSDRKLKQNIKPLSNAISIINRLNPSTYTFRTEEFKQMNLPPGEQYGLIADEVAQIIPGAVKKTIQPATYENHDMLKGKKLSDEVEFNAVNYSEMIPVLIGAVKEQQEEIETLKSEVRSQKSEIENLKSSVLNGLSSPANEERQGNSQSVQLNALKTPYLGQNSPNPFNSETHIDYYIPEALFCGNETCSIIFSDQLGRTIQETAIANSGFGTINVSMNNLGSGVYSYKLIVNGEVIGVKKMVFNK